MALIVLIIYLIVKNVIKINSSYQFVTILGIILGVYLISKNTNIITNIKKVII